MVKTPAMTTPRDRSAVRIAKPSASFTDPASYQQCRPRPRRLAMALLGLVLALAGGELRAEITAGNGRTVGGPSAGAGIGSLDGEVRARCWQHGNEIVDVGAFAAAAIPPELRQQAISLEGAGRTAVLLPFADTFCLLTVNP
jgi:hypothetical protein